MRILQARSNQPQEIAQLMRQIGVDPYGIRIMLPKAVSCLLKVDAVSNIAANILKQEMLSLGGDAAIARGALTGKAKATGCLLMGSLAQFRDLIRKLKVQPFGLDKLARELSCALANYQKENFRLDLGRYQLNLAAGNTAIMGILNLTPDSFSGDGLYSSSVVRSPCLSGRQASSVEKAVSIADKMVRDGAAIIDIGGESSRPGARPVSVKEETKRVIPVLKKIIKKIKAPVSIDTYKPAVARAALDNGASIVNDITGLKNPGLVKAAARYKAAVVVMHMQGAPRTMQRNPRYHCLIEEIMEFLSLAIGRAEHAGISREKIIVDPGLGFGKAFEHNLRILKRLDEFRTLGRPILVGPSRKSFIGQIVKADAGERVFGTIGACVAAACSGAKIFRVHDVRQVRQALDVYSAIERSRYA